MALQLRDKAQVLREEMRRGLLVKFVLDRMSWRGVLIEPYLMVTEEWSAQYGKQFETGYEDFETGFLGESDMALVSARGWQDRDFYLQKLAEGQKCFGLRKAGRLAGFTWANLKEFHSTFARFALAPWEAYLYDIWIFEAFRGQGLAPYLRFRFYEALRAMGIGRMYSSTHFFNTPSVKFKAKLGAKSVKLVLLVDLYGRYRRTFEVRRYAQGRK